MSGLAFIYKKRTMQDGIVPQSNDNLAWIKNKILYGYYMNNLEDRLLVERLLNTTLVPYQMDVEQRMKMLLFLVSSIDERAEKAFAEILKNRAQ
jgi:sister-chromatid-cohesion protein PDS5